MKFSVEDFLSKIFLSIWSHLLKQSLKKNFIFCAVKFIGTSVHRFLKEFSKYYCHDYLKFRYFYDHYHLILLRKKMKFFINDFLIFDSVFYLTLVHYCCRYFLNKVTVLHQHFSHFLATNLFGNTLRLRIAGNIQTPFVAGAYLELSQTFKIELFNKGR